MSGATSVEEVFSAIEESCGLLDIACSRDKVLPFLTAYGYALEQGVFFTTWTGAHAGELNYALLLPSAGADPYDRALSSGFIAETDHPIGTLLSDIQGRCPVSGYGVDFGVADGFKEIHSFFRPDDMPGLSKLASIPSMPRSLAENAGFLARHGLGGNVVGLTAINYQHRTVNVYFGGLRLEPESILSMLRGIGMPEPSEQVLELIQKAFAIYPTFSWDSPKINRICFAVIAQDPIALPARIEPGIEQFAKSAPYAYAGKRTLVYGITFAPGEEYYTIQSYYLINPPTRYLLAAFDANKAQALSYDRATGMPSRRLPKLGGSGVSAPALDLPRVMEAHVNRKDRSLLGG